MFIRPATNADADTLAALFCEFFEEDGIATPPEAIVRNLARMLADDRACFFVAEEAGIVAGFSSGSLTYGVEFGCAAELEDLYLRPQFRGRGWAKPLVASVLTWAEQNGATETILVITPQAEADQSLTGFYEKFGFRNSQRITMYRINAASGA